jgi:UrcA family protein
MRNLPVLAAFIAVAACPLTAALAQGTGSQRSETVRFADLDLNNHEGAVTLYHRLHAAATQVCTEPFDDAAYAVEPLYQRCIDHALTTAVLAVHVPALTAYAQARGIALPESGAQPR